jgi:uncharacterized membrane protein YfcA
VPVTGPDLILLAVAGVVAGVVSTVASLASLVSYPALLAVGLPPLAANVTNTVAMIATGVGAAAGSRPELRGQARRVARLAVLTGAGGATGAALLLLSPASAFETVAPWLIGGASVVLLLQPRLVRRAASAGNPRRHARHQHVLLFLAAIYGGYFGAASGIIMIAVLGPLLAQPLASVSAVKNVLAGAANAVAAVAFALFAPVDWLAVLPLAAGFLAGGWIGPAVVRRLPAETFRVVVALCGLLAALYLGLTSGE